MRRWEIPSPRPIAIPNGPVRLRVEVDEERLYFAYRLAAGPWQRLPQIFDASILSDEAQLAGIAQFHWRLCGLGLSGHGRNGRPRRFRLVFLSRARFSRRSFRNRLSQHRVKRAWL